MLGGLSLLLVVAMVFQASGDVRAVSCEGVRGQTQRTLAEVQPKVAIRFSRKQSERPAIAAGSTRRVSSNAPAAHVRPLASPCTPRRPGVLLTDLPPPLV
jgi:hypothetical protein